MQSYCRLSKIDHEIAYSSRLHEGFNDTTLVVVVVVAQSSLASHLTSSCRFFCESHASRKKDSSRHLHKRTSPLLSNRSIDSIFRGRKGEATSIGCSRSKTLLPPHPLLFVQKNETRNFPLINQRHYWRASSLGRSLP